MSYDDGGVGWAVGTPWFKEQTILPLIVFFVFFLGATVFCERHPVMISCFPPRHPIPYPHL